MPPLAPTLAAFSAGAVAVAALWRARSSRARIPLASEDSVRKRDAFASLFSDTQVALGSGSTQCHASNETLRGVRLLIEQIIEVVPVAMLVMRADDITISSANSAAAKLTGYSKLQLIGKDAVALLGSKTHPEHQKGAVGGDHELLCALGRSGQMHAGMIMKKEQRSLTRSDGESFPVSITMFMGRLRSQDLSYVTIIEDESKSAKIENLETSIHFATLNAALARKELEQTQRASSPLPWPRAASYAPDDASTTTCAPIASRSDGALSITAFKRIDAEDEIHNLVRRRQTRETHFTLWKMRRSHYRRFRAGSKRSDSVETESCGGSDSETSLMDTFLKSRTRQFARDLLEIKSVRSESAPRLRL